MLICKRLDRNDIIDSLDSWQEKCHPVRNSQWKDGCSAKETAKYWLNAHPNKVIELLGDDKPDIVSPEYETKFDDFGKGRQHDLLMLNLNNKVIIGVEAKVDEPFGRLLKEKLEKAPKTVDSKITERIGNLRDAVLGCRENAQLQLRYQLLYSIGGLLAEAKRMRYNKVIFIVQTFLTNSCNMKKVAKNDKDLNDFIALLTNGKIHNIADKEIVKIGTVKGNDFIPNDVTLLIGKVNIKTS